MWRVLKGLRIGDITFGIPIVINTALDSGQRPAEKDLSKGRFVAFYKEFLTRTITE